MGEREMGTIAELMDDLLHKGRPTDEVWARVIELKQRFTTIRYCFGAGEAAYRYYDLVGHDPT
jgi:hypothetical protein